MRNELSKKIGGFFSKNNEPTKTDFNIRNKVGPEKQIEKQSNSYAFKAMSREQKQQTYHHVFKSEAPPPTYYTAQY
jgi:hypothetical protein